MTDKQPPNDSREHEDRLIDVGLRELLGGETPPDLTEKILAAAGESDANRPVSLAVRSAKKKSRQRWLTGIAAAAASIMIAWSLLAPASRPIAWRSVETTNLESAGHSLRPQVEAEQAVEYGRVQPAPMAHYEDVTSDMSAQHGGGLVGGAKITDLSTWQPARSSRGGNVVVGQQWSSQAGTPMGGEFRGRTMPRRGSVLDGVNRPVMTGPRMGKNPLVMHEIGDPMTEQGTGPGFSGDEYTRIVENPFVEAIGASAVSTFSIDVDTASYSNVRQFLLQQRTLPPPDAVRIEEFINYFDYEYADPTDDRPFAAHVEAASCPWNTEHQLVRVALKGREPVRDGPRPLSNLVFLVDVSGSMNQPNKLPLVVEGLRYLTRELTENDRVAIVVYASSEGLALPSTPGSDQQSILQSLDNLRAGGSTAGGAGITLAYQVAEQNFIKGGVNRVVLCTDGDFNVGTTSTAQLERLAETKAKETGTFLTVLGFGRGNLNDAMMETISNKGNGNYHYIDNEREARKVLVDEMSGTLVTIAKDVKIQVEFNPANVAGYRLIGYENRMLAREDFNDDTKDAGEIGAGHTVTALYEVIPSGQPVPATKPDPLKYQHQTEPNDAAAGDELLTIRLRYKQPDGDTSTKIEFPVPASDRPFEAATSDFRFASAVASFGMLLRGSEYAGDAAFDSVIEILESTDAPQQDEYRSEFISLVKQARSLSELQ